MDRVILHCDCNSFFASVECLRDPSLWQVPMAVCGSVEDRRGIVLAKNEPAKRYGIRTAETVYSAKRKCPSLVIVPPHHGEYARISREVNKIYARFTDRYEPFSIDESWLDVTGSRALFGTGEEIAERIRETVKREIGITISIGVSFNKTFAKLGSDYKKPDAVTVISRENYRSILYPLPIEDMLFVGERTAALLRSSGIRTIGDLAAASPAFLVSRLGKAGEQLSAAARGEDTSPVIAPSEAPEVKSVGNGMTFRHDITTREEIRLGLSVLSEEIGERMRRRGLLATTVSVTIKDPALRTISRQRPLSPPTNLGRELAEAALSLVDAEWGSGKPIRMLTVTAMNLVAGDEGEQIGFFDGERDRRHEKAERIEVAVDGIRGRFGSGSLVRGAVLGNDLGIEGGTATPAPHRRRDANDKKKGGNSDENF
ncbi:MAG: DNA polymerase IV [Clostridia bacterium]|nr:DNA polymerase IV [Clostridia bacterium]